MGRSLQVPAGCAVLAVVAGWLAERAEAAVCAGKPSETRAEELSTNNALFFTYFGFKGISNSNL